MVPLRLAAVRQWPCRHWNRRLLSDVARRPFKPSYWHHPGAEPLSPWTVGSLLDLVVERWGQQDAVVSVWEGRRLSFEELREQVDRLASGLLTLGLKPGDRVGLWGPNSTDWYIANLAAGRAGIIVVYINPAYQPPEVQYCLSKVGAKALISAESFKSDNYYQKMLTIVPELNKSLPGDLNSPTLPTLKSLIVMSKASLPGTFRFGDVMEAGTEESNEKLIKLQTQIQTGDGANIQFTSGTSGQPKAALLSHHGMLNNAYITSKRLGLDQKQHRICLQVPLFHCFGNVVGIFAAMHRGATIVIPGPSFKGRDSLQAIHAERCTFMYGTPTMYVDVLSATAQSDLDLSSLEAALCSGAPAAPELLQQIRDKLGLQRVCSVYGMTETSPVTFASQKEDTWEQTLTTVGHVSEHLEVKVVDTEGKMVPMGSAGELWVRGYATMLGYWGDAAKTRNTITDDYWIKTGDQFVLKEDGYGHVVGRLKDMIIRGGENIFPREIEDFLQTHPDILEAQVFGMPDTRLGEVVCACIRLRNGASLTREQLVTFCKGKISYFKIPKHIKVVTEFPKTTSGKIQKFKLPDLMNL